AFDKTGTLTTGLLQVTGITSAAGIEPARVAYLAGMAEYGVNHPIATALRQYAQQQGWPERASLQARTQRHPRGVSLEDAQGTMLVGARTWLREMNVQNMPQGTEGPGMVHVSLNGVWLGAIQMQDTPREQVRSSLE